MDKKNVYNKIALKEHRKELRNKSTSVEVILWNHLKGKKTGFKFRRQYSVGNYILDFYCTEKRLAIELDGAGHFTEEGQEQDTYRDEELKQRDIKILRFENKQIEENIDQVLKTIQNNLNLE